MSDQKFIETLLQINICNSYLKPKLSEQHIKLCEFLPHWITPVELPGRKAVGGSISPLFPSQAPRKASTCVYIHELIWKLEGKGTFAQEALGKS